MPMIPDLLASVDDDPFEPLVLESGTPDDRREDATRAGVRCHALASRIPADRRPSRGDMARQYAATLRAEGADELTVETLYGAWVAGYDAAEREAADDAAHDAHARRQRMRRA